MDIRSTQAALAYARSRPATEPDAAQTLQNGGPAGAMAQGFVDMLQQAERTAEAALAGDADPHALVEALSQSQLAVETAVTVRDKVVEAYQEILRMPV